MKKFQTKTFISELIKNDFVRECSIPIGYKATFPIVKKFEDKVLLTVPYIKIQRTKTKDVSAVLPVTYTVTFELHAVKDLPEEIKKISKKEEGYSGVTPVSFKTLKYCGKFAKIDFSKPMELFPHKALKEMGKEEYAEKVEKVYAAYDAVINDYLGLEKASSVDRLELKQLLDALVGPATKKMYGLLDEEFAKSFLVI